MVVRDLPRIDKFLTESMLNTHFIVFIQRPVGICLDTIYDCLEFIEFMK